ncbi:MAG TPA: DNA polymerase III subunit delta' [Nitrospirota bacterium]|nr:DNA polymerase III subunit delta' [Nitrospirota bacterium]
MGFGKIRGQDRAINILKRAISTDHVAHAYIFHGPDGIGKKMAAMSFAMAINCTEDNGDACGHCNSCRKIISGIHPDFTLLDQESGEIKIAAIRDVINGMIYKPLEAKKRVIIVNGAERFNLSSSNAFLKTLEEPPADTVIILITSSPDMLLQTILSRCQKVSFSQIAPHIIAGILMDKMGIEEGPAEFVAHMSDGSPGKAISLSSEDVQQIRLDIVNGLFTTSRGSRGAVFELSEKFSKDDGSFYNILFWIITCLRDMLVLKEKGDAGLIINKDMSRTLSELKDWISVDRLLDTMGMVKSAYKGQERNMNRQLALDVLVNKIADSMI